MYGSVGGQGIFVKNNLNNSIRKRATSKQFGKQRDDSVLRFSIKKGILVIKLS